jgi:hypothetical protein
MSKPKSKFQLLDSAVELLESSTHRYETPEYTAKAQIKLAKEKFEQADRELLFILLGLETKLIAANIAGHNPKLKEAREILKELINQIKEQNQK